MLKQAVGSLLWISTIDYMLQGACLVRAAKSHTIGQAPSENNGVRCLSVFMVTLPTLTPWASLLDWITWVG